MGRLTPVSWCAAAGLVLAVAAVAALPTAPPSPAEFECRFVQGPIKIDGRLDEAAWKHAQAIDHFYLPWLPTKPAAQAKTRARLLWDRDYLYFAAEMEDADLFADVKEHDGRTWDNDVFEVFLKPADDKPGYYEFHVTPANTITDLFFPKPGQVKFHRGVRDDEFHVEAKVRLDGTLNKREDRDKGWTVEGRIPWYDFLRTGGRPDIGERWKFALCRYDYRIDKKEPELSTCAPLRKANFHLTEDYPYLRFVGPPASTVATWKGTDPHPLERIKNAWQAVPSKVVGSPEPPSPYRVQRVLPKLQVSFPVVVVNEPGSKRLWFLDQQHPYGQTRLCRTADDPSTGKYDVLLDLKALCFDVAFHPRFRENGYVYVGGACTLSGKPDRNGVTRYTVGRKPPYGLDPKSAKVIIDWPEGGHSGCAMAFDKDGLFYVTTGDSTSDSDALLVGQRLDLLLSKVLRIDLDRPDEGKLYSVPKDNPFVGTKDARPETWAYGFRNPWRMSIDHATGQVWVGNNGQDSWEQIYLVQRGANYGWSVYEGSHPFYLNRKLGPTPVSKPMFEHPHSEARSLSGGVVYRGKRLPKLHGAFVYGDFATGRIWAAKVDGRRVVWHEEVARTQVSPTVFALDADGELLIADHVGAPDGGFYTLVPNDRPDTTAAFPRTLSETGLFASVKGHRLADGLIPYSVNSQLWSDGAYKERAIYLPPTAEKVGPPSNGSRPPRTIPGTEEPARIDVTDHNGWNFPERTVIVKSFALEREAGNPKTRHWIETRLLTRQVGEWVGYTYRWNDEQTEAHLVAKEGQDQNFEVKSPRGEVKKQQWRYPSRAECMACHSREANYVLGLSTAQMNKAHDYGGVTANQLEVLEYLGVLRCPTDANKPKAALRGRMVKDGLAAAEADKLVRQLIDTTGQRDAGPTRFLTRPAAEYPRLVDPYDTRQDLTARARSYLHANCAHCHVTNGGGNAQIDLHFGTPLARTRLIDVEPMHDKYGLAGARLVAPGHPDRSVLLHRLATRGRGQMPPLATAVVDEQAVELIREWVRRSK